MNNSSENIEQLIQQYVHGQLQGEQLLQFEKQMAVDATLRASVGEEQMIFDLYLDADALELKGMMQSDFKKTTEPKDSAKYWWISGLVALSLLTGAYYFTSEEKETIKKESVPAESVNAQGDKQEKQEVEKKISSLKQEIIAENSVKTISAKSIETIVDEKVVPQSVPKASETVKDEGGKTDENIKTLLPKIVKETEPVKLVDKCAGVVFSGDVKVISTIKGENVGALSVDGFKTKGGEKPYLYAIKAAGGFDMSTNFTELAKGKYTVYVQDKNLCEGILVKDIQVKETKCIDSYQKTFTLSYETEWKIPVLGDEGVKVTLVDKIGSILVNETIQSDNESIWRGQNASGQAIGVGSYKWLIEYADGEKCLASITILN